MMNEIEYPCCKHCPDDDPIWHRDNKPDTHSVSCNVCDALNTPEHQALIDRIDQQEKEIDRLKGLLECGEIFYGYMRPGQINGMDFSVPRRCTLERAHHGTHGYAIDPMVSFYKKGNTP